MTPRARREPPLNPWLAERLPDPADVLVQRHLQVAAPERPAGHHADPGRLGLQPIDLLYLADLDLEQAMSELDDRILQAVRYGTDAHPDLAVTILYAEPVGDRVTFFQLAPLVRSLRGLVLGSRPLGPTDMALPLETTHDEGSVDDAELEGRVNAAIGTLTARRDALVALETDTSDLDAYARKVSREFLSTALHGIPQLGTGEIHGDIRAVYDAIAAKVRQSCKRWRGKSAAYAALLATWPTLTTDEERFALLREAEGLISASTTAVPPADPGTYRGQVAARKLQFDGAARPVRSAARAVHEQGRRLRRGGRRHDAARGRPRRDSVRHLRSDGGHRHAPGRPGRTGSPARRATGPADRRRDRHRSQRPPAQRRPRRAWSSSWRCAPRARRRDALRCPASSSSMAAASSSRGVLDGSAALAHRPARGRPPLPGRRLALRPRARARQADAWENGAC